MNEEECRYRVRWEIDIWATSAAEAARLARLRQIDPLTIASVFDVKRERECAWRRIDLSVFDVKRGKSSPGVESIYRHMRSDKEDQ